MIWKISAFLIALLPGWVMATPCSNQRFDKKPYTVCQVDLTTDQLKLFLSDETGVPYGHFSQLPQPVQFAMNAGMYHADRVPVGLYIENGIQIQSVITSAGPGNFGMVPNGLLCLRPGRADVFETSAYVAQSPVCTDATQSGPMLVIDGALHPRFIPGSKYLNVRNGVGTSDDGKTAYFAIANQPVNFHEFARLFRDHLGVNHALYLDGRISRLYSKNLNRSDFGTRLGPIIALVD